MSGAAVGDRVTAPSAEGNRAEGDRTAPPSYRDAFLAALFTAPILPSDALVVYSGDGVVRLEAALVALRSGASNLVVVSGGVDNPPNALHADDAADWLVRHGVPRERIVKDADSQNTHEQAEWVAKRAKSDGWQRAIIVASSYHMPRAFLTTVASLNRHGVAGACRVVPLPASHAPWWGKPEGQQTTRADLLQVEFAKIAEYGKRGDVASYEEGLEYLRYWEVGPDEEPKEAA